MSDSTQPIDSSQSEIKSVYFENPTNRPKRSQSLSRIGAALAKAQGQIINAEKTRESMYGAYSTLAATWDAIRKPLSENEIAVYQRPLVMGDRQYMATMLIHSSGEFIDDSILEMRSESNGRMNAMQALGSAVTYARRYTLQAALGIAPEDDDAQGAGDPKKSNQAKPEAKPPAQQQKKENWFDRLLKLGGARGCDKTLIGKVFTDGFGVKSQDVSKEMVAEVEKMLSNQNTEPATLEAFIKMKIAERAAPPEPPKEPAKDTPPAKPKTDGPKIDIGHPDYDGMTFADLVPAGLKLLIDHCGQAMAQSNLKPAQRNKLFQTQQDALAELKARGEG